MASCGAPCGPYDNSGLRLKEAVSNAIYADAFDALKALLDELVSTGELETALAYRDTGGCCGDENALSLLHLAASVPEGAYQTAPADGTHALQIFSVSAAAVITLLIERGADPNVRAKPTAYGYGGKISDTSRGSRPLHVASTAPVVRALLLGGADPDAVDHEGVSGARQLLQRCDAWRGGANSAVSALLEAGHPRDLEPAEHLRLACKFAEPVEVPGRRSNLPVLLPSIAGTSLADDMRPPGRTPAG